MPTRRSAAADRRPVAVSCGLHGAAVWIAYAIVECFVLTIVGSLRDPAHGYFHHRGFVALLFVVYPLAGFVLGVLAGSALQAAGRVRIAEWPSASTDLMRVAAALTLVAASVANIVAMPLEPQATVVPLVNAFLLTSMLIVWVNLPDRFRRSTRSVASPFAVAAILFVVPWLGGEALTLSVALKAVIASSCWIAILVLVAAGLLRGARLPGTTLSAPGHQEAKVLRLAAGAAVTLLATLVPHDATYAGPDLPDAAHPAAQAGPVILISLDTVRADHLSIYGYPRETTPHLKELLQEATLYTMAVSPADMTLPSHASIFTGRYPSWHGAYHQSPDFGLGRALAPQSLTLAEILDRAGYRTFGIVANSPFLGREMGFAQGFQHYDDRLPVRFLGQLNRRYLQEGVRSLIAATIGAPRDGLPSRAADEINREVLPILDRMNGRRERFFLFVNYMDAHWPYWPPPPFDTRFPGKDPDLFRRYIADFRRLEREVLTEARAITPREREYLESQYDGGIAFLDEQVGALCAQLKHLGLYDSSLVIVTSDHGEAFGDRNLLGHGMSVYQDVVHVPLIIKFPNSRAGDVVDTVVSGVDLLPTILAVLGLPMPSDLQGQSLRSRRFDESPPVMSESFSPSELHGFGPRFRQVRRALFNDEFKAVTFSGGRTELYAFRDDRQELRNLAPKHPEVALRLETALNRWLSMAVAQPAAAEKIDSQTRERLKALGYIR